MKTWKKLYRVTWTECMEEADLITAVKDAFPEAVRPTWETEIEDRTLYICDAEGEVHFLTTIYCLNKYAIQKIMEAFVEYGLENPMFYKVKNEGMTRERLRDATDWWPDIDEDIESAVLDSQSLHLTIVRLADDDVDPVEDGLFAATDEQVGKMFRALRNVGVNLVNSDVWKDVLFNTGCEMIAVAEEIHACPSDW